MSTMINNSTTLAALAGLSAANMDAAKASERLATGSRINRPSDDPAGIGKASILKAEITSFMQVKRNLNSAISDLQAVGDGYSAITDYLTEMRALALSAASESDQAVLDAYQAQFSELVTGIGEVVASVKFGGTAAIGSGGLTTTIQDGISNGETKSLTFDAADATTLSVATLSISAAASASAAITSIESAIDTVSKGVAKVGGYQNVLETTSRLADDSILAKSSQYGNLVDADLALEASNLAAAKIRQDASTAVLAQANSMNRNIADYLLNGALG